MRSHVMHVGWLRFLIKSKLNTAHFDDISSKWILRNYFGLNGLQIDTESELLPLGALEDLHKAFGYWDLYSVGG
jgi:hypothetical protein